MNRKVLTTSLAALGLALWAAPVFAWHGAPDSTQRDPWIDPAMDRLVEAGWVKKPARATSQLTNRQMADLTGEAMGLVLAQAGLPPLMPGDPGLPGSGDPGLPAAPAYAPKAAEGMTSLMEEFKKELSDLEAKLGPLEDRSYDRDRLTEALRLLQEKYLKWTGTEASGYSRGYFHATDFRDPSNPVPPAPPALSQPQFTDVLFMEMDFKSIPVPYNLFDLRLRIWRTIGLYYADPIATKFEFRWISLQNFNDVCNLTGGDFYEHYTPLTLWNPEVPVYTLLEPTSYEKRRKEAEEIVFMDHGNDWRLRGFRAAASWKGEDPKTFSGVKGQVMVGSLKSPTDLRFGDYFGGSRWTLGLFDDQLTLGGTGLLIWNDPGSANVPYIPNFSATFPRIYKIVSGEGKLDIPFDADVRAAVGGEYAGARYEDDQNNPQRTFEDWAFRGEASLEVMKVKATAKFLNVGPYYYSPGAQTNRFSSLPQNGYLSTNINKDDFLVGYLNKFSLQKVDRPSFAAYDRLSENILPYGDATPNRLGWLFGLSGEMGKGGWIQPKAAWIPDVKEIQPDYVLNLPGNGAQAVDSGLTAPNGLIRSFSGYEGALDLDLSKVVDGMKVLSIGVDYKSQTSDANLGDPLEVKTLIGSLDFAIPVPGVLESLTWSLAYVNTKAQGMEYVLNGTTSAAQHFYLDSFAIGSYSPTLFDVDRTTYSIGTSYSLTKNIRIRGDVFLQRDSKPATVESDYWRISYEASF